MKKYLYIVMVALLAAACQPDNYRTVYPEGNPDLKATMLTKSVLFGTDSVAFRVEINEKETPLSQLQVKVMVGLRVVASELIRTKDLHYEAELKYAVYRRIFGKVFVYGFFGCFADMHGDGGVRFTHGEADDLDALGFQLHGLRVDGHGCGRIDALHAVGKFHGSHPC